MAFTNTFNLGNILIYYLKELRFILFKKYRQEEIRREHFYSGFVRAGDLCFDVGANVGSRTAPLLALGAKVVAVEPLDREYFYLKKKFSNKIEIVHKGLGAMEGQKDFHISRISVLSSFSEEWINAVKKNRFRNYAWPKVVPKEITTLDRLIEQYGVPSFVKIDVEGYELEVLKGLSTPVDTISFEYTVPEQPEMVPGCIERIQNIMPDFLCNYSLGESMEFVLDEWITPEAMKQLALTDAFIQSGFGDVYVRKPGK